MTTLTADRSATLERAAGTSARRLEDEFLDLVLSDADLLRTEFDALITTGFGVVPPVRPGERAGGPAPAAADRHSSGPRGTRRRDERCRHRKRPVRQRSPPTQTPHHAC